jgi:hypothetical protein
VVVLMTVVRDLLTGVAAAQPGISKATVSVKQLDILAAAEVYVAETAGGSLYVLCSE